MTQFNPNPVPNEAGNKMNVSSFGLTFFNDDNMMLQITFLNDSLSVSFRKGVVDPATGKTRYPKDATGAMTNSTLLTPELAATLYEVLVNNFIPWYADGKYNEKGHSVGIFTNRMRNRLLDVYAGPDSKYPQIRLFSNINEDRIPGESYVFTCRPSGYIEDYQPGGNDFKVDEFNGQFAMFIKCLSTFLEAITKAHHHADAVGGSYDKNKVMDYLSKIGNKIGLMESLTRPQYQQSTSSNFNMGNTNAMMQADTSTPPITQMGNLDDMLPF